MCSWFTVGAGALPADTLAVTEHAATTGGATVQASTVVTDRNYGQRPRVSWPSAIRERATM